MKIIFNNKPRIALFSIIAMLSSLNLLSHSTAAFYVTDGTQCYFVLPNWHGLVMDQNDAILSGDGVYFDVNNDGLYVGSLSVNGTNFSPQTTNSIEFSMFTDYIDITDSKLSPSAFSIWQCEIIQWFKTQMDKDVSVTLVWDPSNDPNCSINQTIGNFSLFALVAPFTQCPSMNTSSVTSAAIGATTATARPCITAGSFSVDNSALSSFTCAKEVPLLSEWGLFVLILAFSILLTVALNNSLSLKSKLHF